ncbi:MAG: hypothetical protein ACLU4J_14675 [Butyricimonas paravirosa]
MQKNRIAIVSEDIVSTNLTYYEIMPYFGLFFLSGFRRRRKHNRNVLPEIGKRVVKDSVRQDSRTDQLNFMVNQEQAKLLGLVSR